MGTASSLPWWVNAIWMSISALTLIGGIIWIVIIFWPYLRETKQMQIEGLKLTRDSVDNLERMIDRAEKIANRMEEVFTEEQVEKLNILLNRAVKRTEPLTPVSRKDLAHALDENRKPKS